MSDTELHSLLEHLRGYDPATLIEILNISSDDLIDQFVDYVADNYKQIKDTIGWN